jgi:hypothetical protein
MMGDKDVVERVAKMFGRNVSCSISKNPKWKPMYYTKVYGDKAAGWMMTLYSLMGSRRQQKIQECLGFWKQQTYKTSTKKNWKDMTDAH